MSKNKIYILIGIGGLVLIFGVYFLSQPKVTPPVTEAPPVVTESPPVQEVPIVTETAPVEPSLGSACGTSGGTCYVMTSAVDIHKNLDWTGSQTNCNTVRNATDGSTADNDLYIRLGLYSYSQMYRVFIPVNTAALPDDAIVSSSTLYIYLNQDLGAGGPWRVDLIGSTEADSNNITTADYDQCGSIDSPTVIATSSVGTGVVYSSGWYRWHWTGSTGINLIGISKLCLRIQGDTDNTGASAHDQFFQFDSSNASSSQPYLLTEYTTGTVAPSYAALKGGTILRGGSIVK